ncbi:TPA: hypothetical protein DCR49_05540 [Candidatus Delongbacteria bacterium]|nr:hypothetical protein [Candidatus Delongbacteria bacterium]
MLKKIIIFIALLSAAMIYAQVEDKHFIQKDDYFVSDRDIQGNTWIRVNVAKMIEAPTEATRNEGKFMMIDDGKEEWTTHYWQSRIALESELKLGTIVIAFDYATGDTYVPPKERDNARTGSWFMAKITDISTLYKGYVMVSGGYNVRKDNIRVIGTAENMTVKVADAPVKQAPSEVVKVDVPVKKEIVIQKEAFQDPNLKIVKAMYGDFLEDNSMDVTDILNAKVKDGNLKVTCTDAFLGVNFRTANEKSLQLQYQTKDGIFETVVMQGMSAKLPDKYHRKVK